MANNRMYLVCRGCGKHFMLGKTMATGYYTNENNFEDELNKFYDDHKFCNENEIVNNENQFELKYEIAYDEKVKEL